MPGCKKSRQGIKIIENIQELKKSQGKDGERAPTILSQKVTIYYNFVILSLDGISQNCYLPTTDMVLQLCQRSR
jgi:hypothetical protein